MQSKNAGCGIRAPENDTYTVGNESCVHSTAGSGFNAQGGGVYATLWTSAGVSVYFFPREYIPSDIKANKPDPSTWTSKPQAVFSGNGCNFDSQLKDMKLVINTELCGDWAGNTWEADGAAAETGVKTCAEYVQNNPQAFKTAYWLINSISIFSNETPASPDKAQDTSTAASPTELFISGAIMPRSSLMPSYDPDRLVKRAAT